VIDGSQQASLRRLNEGYQGDENNNHCNHDRCLEPLVSVADREIAETPAPTAPAMADAATRTISVTVRPAIRPGSAWEQAPRE
jgi:hypothetical protein